MLSSKTDAVISQFANKLRCEWLSVRQEEQLSPGTALSVTSPAAQLLMDELSGSPEKALVTFGEGMFL